MTDQNNYAPQNQAPQQAQPQQQPMQQQPMQQVPMQQPPMQQPQQAQYYAPQGAPVKSATTLIVLSVLEILFLGGLFGIIPLVFAVQANSAYKMGDIAGGDAKAKTAKTALIVVAVVAIVILVALFAMGGAALFTAASSS